MCGWVGFIGIALGAGFDVGMVCGVGAWGVVRAMFSARGVLLLVVVAVG